MSAKLNETMIPASEIEAIIAAAVERKFAAAMEKFQPAPVPTPANDLQELIDKLALAITGVNDQGKAQKPVPPEELAKRNKARVEMEKLIAETVEKGVQPMYRPTAKMFLGDRLIEPLYIDGATKRATPNDFGWWSVPNTNMQPINDEAKAIVALFHESIGSGFAPTAVLRITPGGLTVRSGGLPVTGGTDVTAASRVGRDRGGFVDWGQPSFARGGNPFVQQETRVLGTVMAPSRHATPM